MEEYFVPSMIISFTQVEYHEEFDLEKNATCLMVSFTVPFFLCGFDDFCSAHYGELILKLYCESDCASLS